MQCKADAGGAGRVLQYSTAGTKNSTHGDQLYIGIYLAPEVRANPHSTQILAAFVLWGCGGALAAAVVVMVMFVGYCIAVPTLGYCWGTAGYCLQYPGYCLQYPK